MIYVKIKIDLKICPILADICRLGGCFMKKYVNLLLVMFIIISLLPGKGQVASNLGEEIVAIANQYEGIPYQFGGTTTAGFDCSGYTVYVYNQVGITLPRTAEGQFNVGTSIEKEDLQMGDLVYFENTYKEGISHVGIYIGENEFISATNSGVKIYTLDNSYWNPKYVGAKRVIEQQELIEYKDFSDSHYAFDAVQNLSSQGVISGYADGTFRPDVAVTRGQAATMINRVLKYVPKNNAPSYTDVTSGHIFATDIAAMKELGIINGFKDETFRPDETLTRAQMAVIVKNAFNLQQSAVISSADSSIYTDIASSYWAHDAIVTMKMIDLTSGFKTDLYRPSDQATRADFSAAVYNGMHFKESVIVY